MTPGTTSTGTPASRHAPTSSMPRANTWTSPPLSRTTRSPASARSTSSCCTSSWRQPPDADLPTVTTSPGTSTSGASRSRTTTSAPASSCRARTVSSPGSPGPPPTRATEPGPGRRRRRSGGSTSSCSARASRRATARRGSRPALTDSVTSPERATAGTQAGESAASSARTHQTRAASQAAATSASTTARARVDEPAALDVGRAERPQHDVVGREGDLGRDDPHERAGLHQAAVAAGGDRSPADHEDPASGEVEVEGGAHAPQCRRIGQRRVPVRPRRCSTRRSTGANSSSSTAMPTARMPRMPAMTRLMSDRKRPWSSRAPRPSPSSGLMTMSSAAMSERHENAQPWRRPPT